MNIILLALLLTTTAFSHDNHDWRTDYEAYLSVTSEPMVFPKSHSRSKKRIDLNEFKKNLLIISKVERGSNANLDLTRTFLAEEYKKLDLKFLFNLSAQEQILLLKKKEPQHRKRYLFSPLTLIPLETRVLMIMVREPLGP